MNHYPLILSSSNSPAGVGPPVTITVTGAGQAEALALLHLPPRRSFGIGARMTDAAGTPVAWLRSPHAERKHGSSSSSYCIYAARPQAAMAGQAATAIDTQGTQGFLWATVTRKPFSNKHTVTDANGQHVYTGRRVMGFDTKGMQTWLLETAQGQGCAHVSRQKGSSPPLHDICVAKGADPAFALCVMYAATLATEELYEDNTHRA